MISTKTGDGGETSIHGERVKKHHPRIECLGTIDELNAKIGIARNYVRNESIKDILKQIQNDLFTVQAEVAKYDKKTTDSMICFLDKTIQTVEEALPKQTQFLLPTGDLGTVYLHLARAICRRAERTATKLADYDPIRNEILQYLNRLSDLLHLFARVENSEEQPVTY